RRDRDPVLTVAGDVVRNLDALTDNGAVGGNDADCYSGAPARHVARAYASVDVADRDVGTVNRTVANVPYDRDVFRRHCHKGLSDFDTGRLCERNVVACNGYILCV